MNKYLVLVAGGKGNRFGGNIPKQYLLINDIPIYIHTLLKFTNAIPELSIIIVCANEYHEDVKNQVNKYFPKNNFSIVENGTERFHSVKNGIESIENIQKDDLIAIHDAVRPLVSVETILNCFEKAEKDGSAIPFKLSTNSLRIKSNTEFQHIDRSLIIEIQTPQVFNVELLKQAFEVEYQPTFTDDASVFENSKNLLHYVEGNIENIKITTPFDFEIAKLLLNEN